MSRNRGELQFGSDSFLDVVCNLVGVLILLIVMTGVRVSRAPVMVFPGAKSVDTAIKVGAGEPDAPSPFHIADDSASAHDEAIGAPVAEPEPIDNTAELAQQLAELEHEHGLLQQQRQAGQSRLQAAHEIHSGLSEKLDAARTALAGTESDLTEVQQYIVTTTAELSQLREQAAQLEAQIRTAQHASPAAQQIKHHITPVGKTVTGDELHFRVERNRVAVVPLEELLKRLKEQIERRKDWLAKSHQHEGEVGPVNGFTLRYVVQRENPSVVDELRYGAGMYRISVAQWELELDRSAIGESIEQALRPGSKFYQALLEAKNDSALTFWVYPDSFEGFGRLREFCHEQNFLVAGRPLPAGVPIAGSPRGSRSMGQ